MVVPPWVPAVGILYPTSSIPYASDVGSIMYAMLYTRPDVAYILGIVSRFQTDPGEDHWKAVKNILKYLRRTRDIFLIYGRSDLKLKIILILVFNLIRIIVNLYLDMCSLCVVVQ